MPRPELAGLLLDGRYELRHVLGAGGFATVYLAHDHRLHDREVAIKVLHPEHLTSADHVGRFAREIKVAARIGASCEHLVKITDHGRCVEPPLLYFVMEYLAGPSLRQVLTDVGASALSGRRVQRPLPWPRAVTLALQLSAAMTALHRQGVIHRDIKPENLIIEASGVGDLLKLLDYGIAGLAPGAAISGDGPRTAVRHVLGTPRYMAPEQLHDGVSDHRADIFAAGAILAEMLTGEPPRPPGAAQLLPPSQRAPGSAIPSALDELVLRATAWDPAARFASADELSAALVSVLRDAAAAAAADDATTLAVARGAASSPLAPAPTPPADRPAAPIIDHDIAAAPTTTSPRHVVAPRARGTASPAIHDRWLMRLGRLAGATFLTTSTLGSLALVFALFTVVRHARSQAPASVDLLREDNRGRAEADDLARPEPPTRRDPDPAASQVQAAPAADAAPIGPLASPPEARQPEAPTAPPEPERQPETPPITQPEPGTPQPEPPPIAKPEPEPPQSQPAMTIEQIVRAAERKIRARCGSRGGDRLVEYTLVFAPGTPRLVDVRVEGEHRGRELGDCVEMAARKIDFRGARDRVKELPRALYRM